MDNFVVSARKYRPSTFNSVIGQEYIVTTLKNAIKNNQLAQTFLFAGQRGVGKTTCARILAKTINCINLTEDYEACNKCNSCCDFNQLTSFNIHELDAASNNSVDDIRTLVEQVRIPPQAGKYKIYIIDEVHMLSVSAFNAFLKTLEEPPSYAKFILATTEKQKIIPTILSRCQIYDFKRIKTEDISNHLSYVAKNENIEFEPQALHIIAAKSDGALRDALFIFDQMVSYGSNHITFRNVIENLNILDYEYFFKFVDNILVRDITAVLLLLDEIYEKGFDGQAVITGFAQHLRTLLFCRDESTLSLLEIHKDLIKDYQRQSKKCSDTFLIKAIDIMSLCDVNYKSSSNKRFHIELSVIKIMQLQELTVNEKEKQVISNPTVNTKEKAVYLNSENQQQSDLLSVSEKPETYVKQEVVQKQQDKPEQKNTSDFGVFSYEDEIKTKQIQRMQTSSKDMPFSDDDVLRVFEKIKEETKKAGENSFACSIMNNAIIEKKDNNMWSLITGGAVEIETLKSINIIQLFRDKLMNSKFTLDFVVEKRNNTEAGASKEKLMNDLISENPELQRFIQELGAQPYV